MKALTDSYNRQKKERWNSPAIPSLTTLYDDSPAGRRKMVLFLYALVTPPFVLTMSLLAKPFSPYPIAAVFFLCLTAGLWIFFRKNPFQFDWVFPAGIAPTLSCAIASTSFGNNGLAFIAVMTAPLAWSAVLFELPTVITAWTVSTASCFFLSYQSSGFYPAVANTAIFGIIQFLVALVVYGKASRFRTARLESLERSLNDIELIMRTDGRLVEVNDRAVEIYGYTRRELLSMKAAQLRLPEEENLVRQQLKTLLRKRSFLFETQHVRKDGTKIPVEVSARLFQAKGETYIHSLVRDISERKEYEIKLVEANRHLAEKEAFLRLMAESSPFGYLVVDNRTDAITYSNHRFCEIWGIEKLDERIRHGELKNNDIIPDCLPMLEDIPAFAESCKPLQDEKNRITIEDRIPFVGNRTIRRFSTQVRNDNDEYLGRFYIFEDITRQKRLEEEILRANAALEVSNRALNRLTITDSLTGIFNRRHFDTMLEFEWKRAQRKSECISLIMIDIDYFKNYNDHYGHQAGDECLRQVAGAIREGAGRTADIPARYGGEEFAVILPETDLHGAMIVAETIRLRVLSLQIPHALSTTGQSVSISIGIGCRNPQQNEDGSVLVADADQALYMAKKSGRNCVQSDLRLSA